MDYFYLYDYILNNNKNNKFVIDLIKNEIDSQIYHYGEQFRKPDRQEGLSKAIQPVIGLIKNAMIQSRFVQSKKIKENSVISNANNGFTNELSSMNFNIYNPFWMPSVADPNISNHSILNHTDELKKIIKNDLFHHLLKDTLGSEIEKVKDLAIKLYQHRNIRALFVPDDMAFFSRLGIEVFKELNKKSYIFLHGLPGRYNQIDDNRSDYLIVWGKKIRDNYIRAGFHPDKILISGHPSFRDVLNKKLRFGTKHITVITKSMGGAQHSDRTFLTDRGNLILYLYSIKNVLDKLGIRHVYLRPHPSENISWYNRFIDTGFFIPDADNLQTSLSKSDLVIGPTSTILIDATHAGVNYLVYELSDKNVDVINHRLCPPFDGSDSKIPVAKNENDLEYFIKNKIGPDPSFFSDYIQTPFDISVIEKMIKGS